MDIRIFNRQMILVDVYDKEMRIDATECFSDAGTFSLTVPMADSGRFPPEGIIEIPSLGGYVIEGIERDASAMTARITGRGVLSYFSRRVLGKSAVYEGTAEEVLCSLAAKYGQAVLSAPMDFTLSGLPETVHTSLGGGSLLSAMRSVCDGGGIGMSLTLRRGGFTFGARPRMQTGEILSRNGGHLLGGVHRTDVKNYVNRVIVCAPEGYTVQVDAAGLFLDGIDDTAYPLREKYHYAENLYRSLYETEEAFLSALMAEGRKVLARFRPITAASVFVSSDTAERLTAGGVYTLEDEWFGIRAEAVCTKKSVHTDSEGTTCQAEMTVLPDKGAEEQ